MPERTEDEYTALRATIGARGTAKTCIFVAGLAAWACLSATLLSLAAAPVTVVFPLVVLAGSFEAVFSLHVGVERLGRYLQVFHEDQWEDVAMAFGPPLAGTGADPLFAPTFALAALCNFLPVLVAAPTPSELVVLGVLHG